MIVDNSINQPASNPAPLPQVSVENPLGAIPPVPPATDLPPKPKINFLKNYKFLLPLLALFIAVGFYSVYKFSGRIAEMLPGGVQVYPSSPPPNPTPNPSPCVGCNKCSDWGYNNDLDCNVGPCDGGYCCKNGGYYCCWPDSGMCSSGTAHCTDDGNGCVTLDQSGTFSVYKCNCTDCPCSTNCTTISATFVAGVSKCFFVEGECGQIDVDGFCGSCKKDDCGGPPPSENPSPSPSRSPSPSPSRNPSPSPSPSPSGRPELCDYTNISGSSLAPGESVTIEAFALSDIVKIEYAVYNKNNEYNPGNPKPVCVLGDGNPSYSGDPCYALNPSYKHLIFLDEIDPPSKSGSHTFYYNDLHVKDYNTGGSWTPGDYLVNAQINVYFIDANGGFSLVDGDCIEGIYIVPVSSPSPSPSRSPSPTPSLSPSPSSNFFCSKLEFYQINGHQPDPNPQPLPGDSVSFACSDGSEATYYNFQYQLNNGDWISIPASGYGRCDPYGNCVGYSQEIDIVSGNYIVQCRACRPGGCTPWGGP